MQGNPAKTESGAADSAAESTAPDGPSREELVAEARRTFDLVQRVRINSAILLHEVLAQALGISPSALSLEKLRHLDYSCRRADLSRGPFYVERGLLYGLAIFDTDRGYKVGYKFLRRNDA
jgi:hypothetical protein